MRRAPDDHPLYTELRVGRLVGWQLIAVTLLSGAGCGLLALVLSDPGALADSPLWLAVPASIPFCFALVRRRSLLLGAIGGLFAASLAFLIVGLYGLWEVACLIITFMGEC